MRVSRLVIVVIFIFSSIDIVYSQTLQETDLQMKYWNYRNRMKRDFSLIGSEQANSLVMQNRQYANGSYPFLCSSSNWGGVIEWGDALAHHGTYLSLLATEYFLLRNNNQPTDETLIELYYAIATLSRMDQNLDKYFDSPNTWVESGVLTRDDIYIDFENEWSFLVPDVPNIGPMMMKSMGASTHRNGDCAQETFRPENIWSKDHIVNLLFGLCMIKKMVDNPYVKPETSDVGFYIQDEIARIVDIWMTKFSEGHAWQETKYAPACGNFTVTESINWFIMNDITDEPVGPDAGPGLAVIAYPLNEMAK